MTQNLSYPIGPFSPPERITADYLADCIERIRSTPERLRQAVAELSDEQLDTPYRPGGWTVRQVVHHVPDSHINCYIRFHWTLTEDNPLIKAYDEKSWASLPYHAELPVETSLNLLEAIHARWVVLLDNLSEADLERSFRHPEDGSTNSLRKTIASYAWHGDHHIAHITSLRERMGW